MKNCILHDAQQGSRCLCTHKYSQGRHFRSSRNWEDRIHNVDNSEHEKINKPQKSSLQICECNDLLGSKQNLRGNEQIVLQRLEIGVRPKPSNKTF